MASTGWKFGTVATQVNRGGGWVWTDISKALDAAGAAFAIPWAGVTTYDIVLSAPDMSSVPDGATIDGIEVRFSARRYAGSNPVRLTRAFIANSRTVVAGTNLAASPVTITASYVTYTLGSSTNKWGQSPDSSYVKSSDFSVFLAFLNDFSKYDAGPELDSVEFNVHYTAAASPPSVSANSASATYGVGGTVQMSATNTPTSWSLPGSPPTGVSVNSSGLVTWTSATPAGVHSITVRATNAGGDGDGTLTLTITAAGHVRRTLLGVG